MDIRLAAPITHDSVVDGPGIRNVVWTQGCPHNCYQCHNPGTHDFNGGFLTSVEAVIEELLNDKKGVTFSGGDPFVQPEACSIIAKELKKYGINIWAYSGWTYEQLLELSAKDASYMNFLRNIDRLVDGPFILAKKNLLLPFRGSENQRIINVPASLEIGHVIIDEDVGKELDKPKFDGIFV